MSTQQLRQPPIAVRRLSLRRWSWLGIGLLLVAALMVYNVNRGAPASTAASSTNEVASDPAASISRSKSLGDYLRAQSTIQTDAPTDPAVKSVTDYIRAHESISANSVSVDPATQGVMNYIRVHKSMLDHTAALDPATKSVLDYLRAHGQ